MSSNERDTQFQGFAKLLYEDLEDVFSDMFISRADCDYKQADQSTKWMQTYIAQRAYDLAAHVVLYTHEIKQYPPEHVYTSREIAEIVEYAPDMTEFPEDKP